MGTGRTPRGPGVSFSACLGQFLNNLASWRLFGLDIWPYLQEHARQGFAWVRAHLALATLNLGETPSRRGQVDGPVHGLSAGSLLGASCQNRGGGEFEGVLYVHLHLGRPGHLSELEWTWIWVHFLECAVLTCNPASEIPVTCLRGRYSASQGVVRSLLATGTYLKSTAGMFLRIQSDVFYIQTTNIKNLHSYQRLFSTILNVPLVGYIILLLMILDPQISMCLSNGTLVSLHNFLAQYHIYMNYNEIVMHFNLLPPFGTGDVKSTLSGTCRFWLFKVPPCPVVVDDSIKIQLIKNSLQCI